MTADSDFIKWYLINLLRGIKTIRVEDNSTLHLPYSGDDAEAITRLFKGFCLLQPEGFKPDENNIDVIKTLAEIAAGKTEKKGLVLRGGIGVGKTYLIKEWLKFRKLILAWNYKHGVNKNIFYSNTPEVNILTPTKILSKFTKDGFLFFDDEPIGDILVIDDLAAIEPISYFGNTVNIIEKLIYAVYEKAKDKKNFEFYATTDVTSDNLSIMIGTRAMSRLSEMSLWIEGLMKGSDRRIKHATDSTNK